LLLSIVPFTAQKPAVLSCTAIVVFTAPDELLELEELELEELELEELELEELELDELELDELELELEELELDELELLEEELEDEELLPLTPLQLPLARFELPTIVMLSILARPAALLASSRIKLFPATRFTVTVSPTDQVVHAPVPLKASVATAALLTNSVALRGVPPLA
jgi:hypothetical protein